MKLAFHWRIALWNAAIIGLALGVFGAGSRTVLFAAFVSILTCIFVWRTRRELVRPLTDLARAIGDLAERNSMPLIPRGVGEVRELTGALGRWQSVLGERVRDLSDARIRLESVLSAMDEGVLVFDDARRITLANTAFQRLIDLGRDPLGRTPLEVFRNEALDDAVRNALLGHPVDAVEFQTGSNRVLRALVAPVTAASGTRREAAVMVLEDLTDIRRVDRIRRDFVANVSHEFKTPLTSIRGYAETMMAESADPSHKDFADVICRNARYLESLVNDLLVLARIEAEPPSVPEEVDVRILINEQVGLRKKTPAGASRDIEVDCPNVTVKADSGRLAIALSNLIDNAIRYNRPGGVVRISCCERSGAVRVEVSDQGYGIPADELPRIFERFYRVEKSRNRNAGGTGLGLAIARHAVESQGGSLTVTSRIGTGSTFCIHLPARPPNSVE